MTDNEIMVLIIAEIERQLNLVGLADFEVSRSHQLSNQYTGGDKGDPIKTRIFLYAITKGGDGHGRNYETGAEFKRTDFQQKSKIIQVSVVRYFDFADVNARTPEDVADLVHDLMDSPDAIKALRDDDIFLQEVGNVRPVFFTNDSDRNESVPNFDLTVNYSSSITKSADFVDSAADDIHRV